jgi:RNA polymerase sigma factor (sigma-70 family)
MQELDDIALLREYVGAIPRPPLPRSSRGTSTRSIRSRCAIPAIRIQPRKSPRLSSSFWRKKSRQLGKHVILSGWLYQTARLTAVTFIRGEIRRARREQEAHMQTILNENESDAWRQIAPLLDAAMAGLNETDRHAVVLRFFDGKSMREVGAALGANEDAAKKRVGRAVEKLRTFFAKRGVSSTTAIIAGAISAISRARGAGEIHHRVALAKGRRQLQT